MLLLFSLVFCFCITTLADFVRPRLKETYVISAKNENGKISAYTYKLNGLPYYLGKLCDLALGGSFTQPETIVKTISGNLSCIESSPEPKAEPSPPENIFEKTISSSGGQKKSGNITINNETSYEIPGLSTDEILFNPGSKNKPRVLIVHSHTTESYSPGDGFSFTHTSECRTTDTDYNMIKIGKALKTELEKRGIKCVHITELFDHPQYDNSYARSCDAVISALKENPQIKIVLDLHRDAIMDSSGVKTKLTTTINGEKVAQVMLVVGTDELGLKHDNWHTNLKFAMQLQGFLLEEGENLARPINLRTSRFNGHTALGAVILEVGTTGNTIKEALASTKYVASALDKLLNKYE